MPASDIVIRGAREHNLRSVDVTLPRNKLICLTGVSGSGKSSLAFDTLYAEGQRRYVESLSTFARQFLGQMPKPEVDHISGLSPSISISQKSSGNNPRSTVGTITEIYDFLRVLYARVGHGHCPQCGKPITAQTREQIIARIMGTETGTQYAVLAPVIRGQKGEYKDLFEDLRKQGFVRARVDGKYVSLTDDLSLDRQMRHNIEVVVDRLKAGPTIRGRLAEAVDSALALGKGNLIIGVQNGEDESRTDNPVRPDTVDDAEETDKIVRPTSKRRAGTQPGDLVLSSHFACTDCGISFEEPTPQLFSFNSPQGMCLTCDGLGEFFSFDGDRLVPDPTKSFEQGCIELVGSWKDLGRWKRHIYKGVADTMERKLGLDEGALLEKPWKELTKRERDIWLWGTGEEHITYTWRAGKAAQKYGGTFEGLVPELLEKYNTSKSTIQIRQLEQYMSIIRCPDCAGQRLNPQACAVTVESTSPRFAEKAQRTLPEVCNLAISDTVEFFSDVVLEGNEKTIAEQVLKEIRGRLGFLLNVGLEYLSLDRTAPTLSGGESQRIRLAGQVGCGLVGVLYILDEPSIGLHPRDNQRLLDTLAELRDLGNTVVVVEHDEDTMRAADHLIDFGPGPGVRGGEVVARGTADQIARETRSATGAFLSGKRRIEVPAQRRLRNRRTDNPVRRDQKSTDRIVRPTDSTEAEVPTLRVIGARHNNLKNIDVDIPLGAFVCVTGASGSGKSSIVNDILAEALMRDLMGGKGQPGEHDRIEGVDQLDKLIVIDQSPIGRTPRSNPGTYIKLFDDIRSLYTQLPESKRRGYKPGRFSFNVQGGRCEACEGNGSNRLEMDFLADVWVTCPVCNGHRFNRETLQVMYKEKNIAQVLEMDVQEAMSHFENIPAIHHKLSTLHAVGLDYIKIGQPSPTLSGGEAQRIKLARELVKKSTGRTMYLLDEPTTGLHFADIELLLKVLHDFVDSGNTVLVVEHNLDVVKTADWIIDIGPDGGRGGGRIVACGTPEEVAQNPDSYTGRALAPLLGDRLRLSAQASAKPQAAKTNRRNGKPRGEATHITVRGARQHNLREVDVKIPRDEMTVFCGPSGSGKTSLAMDTIYAEGQRRYVESLSSYARQFVGQMQKPQVDHIDGLSPAIAIEQRNAGHTPRSTVGTVTEIYDYFRILFARLGQPYCPECDISIGTQTSDQIVDKLLEEPTGTKLYIMAPVEVAVGEQYESLWDSLRGGGYIRVRIDGETHSLEQTPTIDRRRKHAVEVIVDRISVRPDARSRIAGSIENALALGKGVVHIAHPDDEVPEPRWQVRIHSQHLACEKCGRSFDTLNPHNFSFNSSLGWCPACEGLGTQVGANPAALLRDANLTLEKGALLVWPDVSLPVSQLMLTALSAHTGVPTSVPYNDLSPRQRRTVLFGTEDQWISVYVAAGGSPVERRTGGPPVPTFRFQYKGLYPALEEASKLSPRLRSLLEQFVGEIDCSECGGSRLRDAAAAVRFRERALDQIGRTPLGELVAQVRKWKLAANEKKVAGELIREIENRLTFLVEVGLDYLTLGRAAPTLSGGEAQRIRLASQVGSGLCGVLYVLDEPTIGLHPRDNNRLIAALKKLRDLGNTLLVVEHDREVIAGSDGLFDFGPGSGRLGGQILASGSPEKVSKTRGSVTGPYLSGKKSIGIPKNRRIQRRTDNPVRRNKAEETDRIVRPTDDFPCIEIVGARHNNLKNINVKIPLGAFTAVTGVSGSGKSSLVEDILYNQLAKTLHRASTVPGAHETIRGIELINKVIRVDQQPLGNTPTSNPATYTGLFDLIRTLFSQLPESKLRGYTARRFSFNVPGGRCETCEGNGQKCIQMHFLPDVWVECETCRGLRYNPDVLEIRFHGKSIADVLNMSCGEAVNLFSNIPKIRRILQTLCDVGLDYLTLGQSAPTLSGGEAQRVKLAAELARPDTGQTLYLLDEPTTGLHFDDLAKLLEVLNRLVDHGNSVVVIEHNLDVIKTADWIIDIGPEAGAEGGTVVACGTPEELGTGDWGVGTGAKASSSTRKATRKPSGKKTPAPSPESPAPCVSHTAAALAPVLAAGPYITRKKYNIEAAEAEQPDDLEIDDVGRETRMPWEVDGRQWHTRDRVARDGRDSKWDGRILDQIERRIQKGGQFAETNWNNRTIVEITAGKKSDGWFFHAITGERWLIKLKFRTAKKTFDSGKLVVDLNLKPLNDIDEIEAYGRGPRVKCKNLRGPWQEVQIDAHSWEEIDTPAFWTFLERAIAGFDKFTERIGAKPEDVMPWKVLGQKWHLSKKGFPPGKKTEWKPEVLEELLEMLAETVPDGQFLWNNQNVVYLMVPGIRKPWATVHTKRLSGIDVILNGPKGAFQLGGVAELGSERSLSTEGEDHDQVKLRFVTSDELHAENVAAFFQAHVESLTAQRQVAV